MRVENQMQLYATHATRRGCGHNPQPLELFGAGGRDRTDMGLRPLDFEFFVRCMIVFDYHIVV